MTRDTFDGFQDPPRGRFGDNEYALKRRQNNPVTLDLYHHRSSDRAHLLSLDGTRARARWLPKSLIDKFEFTGHSRDGSDGVVRPCRVTVAEWKARQEGFA